MSSSSTSSGTAAAASSSSASPSLHAGSNLKVVGIILAIVSGLLIGSSFVFKKRGLLRSQAGGTAGEGVAYLKSPLWWTGMTMMILGELCNFAAYAFIEALVVTPLGALSVVICAILSSIFLKEKLTFFGWLGCALCIIGSVIIALNGPQEDSVGQITDFQKLFLSPGFLVYGSVLILAALVIIFYFGPKLIREEKYAWYIMVCSMIGGISVSVTTGLGAAIVTTAMGDNQFKHWFIYFLIVFVAVTLITEVYYLNMALALFNTAMVTPTYYVIFTFFSMVTTVVLFQGLKASAMQIITVVMGFLVICLGITILQMSKVDPAHLTKLDRRSTMLLQAARNNTEIEEKSMSGAEDPGINALRGSFGTVGSIIRARSARRMSQSGSLRSRPGANGGRSWDAERGPWTPEHRVSTTSDRFGGLKRHQLWDAPVPSTSGESLERISMNSQPSFSSEQLAASPRRPAIKFDSQDVVHQYHPTRTGDHTAIHEHRHAHGSEGLPYSYSPPTGKFQTNPIPGLPPVSEGSDFADEMRQAASVPPRLRDEDLEVQTAPPLDSSRFFEPTKTDPFENMPSTTALTSFPSASESVASSGRPNWEDEDEETLRKHRQRYGKVNAELDREESVSLWHRPSIESDEDAPPAGGVRLVKPTSPNNRF